MAADKFNLTSSIGKLYGNSDTINERHRHRYEVNTDYVPRLEAQGLKFVGHDEAKERMEVIELEGWYHVVFHPSIRTFLLTSHLLSLPGHPFFVATQFHPEFKTRPLAPSPVFLGFILASCGMLNEYLESLANPQTAKSPMTGYKSIVDLHADIETGNVVVVPRSNSTPRRFQERRNSSVGSIETDVSTDKVSPVNGEMVEVNGQ